MDKLQYFIRRTVRRIQRKIRPLIWAWQDRKEKDAIIKEMREARQNFLANGVIQEKIYFSRGTLSRANQKPDNK